MGVHPAPGWSRVLFTKERLEKCCSSVQFIVSMESINLAAIVDQAFTSKITRSMRWIRGAIRDNARLGARKLS